VALIAEDVPDGRMPPERLSPAWRGHAGLIQRRGDAVQRVSGEHVPEDAAHHGARHRVNLKTALGLVTPAVAVERPLTGERVAQLHAVPAAADGALAYLLVLDLGRVAAHEADELPLRRLIQRLTDEAHVNAGMLGLGDDDAQVHRVAAEPVDSVGDDG